MQFFSIFRLFILSQFTILGFILAEGPKNPLDLSGRIYADVNQRITVTFLSSTDGIIENGSRRPFTYRQLENEVSFEGDEIPLTFMRSWFIKQDGLFLMSADGRIRLTLLLPVSATNDIVSDTLDLNACPPSFCLGTRRCWYTVSNGHCVVNYLECRPTKSCE